MSMSKFNAKADHGRVVWAKMSKSSKSWPALVISTEILDLVFDEKPDKIWVYWVGENSFTLVKSNLVFNFCEDFASHFETPAAEKFKNIKYAIKITSLQFSFALPKRFMKYTKRQVVKWAEEHLKKLTMNRIGKRKRDESYYIPNDILQNIKEINLNNVQFAIQSNLKNEIQNKNGKKVVKSSKRKLKCCISCHLCIKKNEKFYNHPLFDAHICEICHENAKDVLMTIADDKSNINCSICFFCDKSDKLVLCDMCIRTYCENCVSIYNPKGGVSQIMKAKPWECFACDKSSIKNNKLLLVHTPDKQLYNVFNLYPAEVCNPKKMLKFSEKPELQIFALGDCQNNVPKVLNQLEYPFKLLKIQNLDNFSINHESITTDGSNQIKLLIQYYPYNKFDKFKLYKCGAIETFLNFILIRDRLQLKYPNEMLFWAFETSAAIRYEEKQFISRFFGKKPILSTIYSRDVRQRARFIWSNITICEKNVAPFRKHNIFLKEIGRDYEDESWCIDSVKLILTSLIQNNIGF